MNIYLLGYMGCGKNKIAKRLAAHTRRDFVDLDCRFENKYGNISDFFKQNGENAFRQAEQELLHESAQLTDSVIALGGGTPCFEDNMDWLLHHGFTVYLKMNELALLQRLRLAQKKRPLLENLSEGELLNFIGEQLMQRSPYYERAHLRYPGINVKTEDLWQQIQNGMQKLAEEE